MRLTSFALVAAIALVGAIVFYVIVPRPKNTPHEPPPHLDRVVIIVLENYRSNNVDPAETGLGQINPVLMRLATENRLEMNYFGVWHPSLPNYIAMIGGDFFGIGDDSDSCFNPEHQKRCSGVDATNLVDQLEEAHIAWEGLFESMPSGGFLGSNFPAGSNLYAQKHNPFVYFKDIALDPARLAKIKPFDLSEIKTELADPASASRFIYIVPNQCHDQHGTDDCTKDVALAAGDAFLAEIVPAIIDSPAFTEQSVLFIAWDDSKGDEACCGAWKGGGRIPFIAVTKQAMAVRGTTPSNHYSLLATVEDGFGLPRIANAQDAATLFDLLPDFVSSERRDAEKSVGAERPESSSR